MDGLEIYLKEIITRRNELRVKTLELEPEADIPWNMATLLGAGSDTTTWLMLYTIYMYAKHPEVQQKLKAEIKSVMGDRDEVTAEDLKKLVYLNMTLRETMRYYAIIPFLTRTTVEDTTLKAKGGGADLFVPKGGNVLMSLSVLHRSEDQWADPSKYIPGKSCILSFYYKI